MNQTTATSIRSFQQLTRNTLSKSWLSFTIIILILCSFGLVFAFFFKVYFPLMIVVIILFFWFKARLNRLKKMQNLNDFKIPSNIWIAFKHRHPEISPTSYLWIEESFKDYLAIHMWRRNSYTMPSNAVDALWHLLIEEFDNFYQSMCQNFLGYELVHKPHDKEPSSRQKIAQRQQLVNTWQAACHLHGLKPSNPHVLPRLFQIDERIQWSEGLKFSLPFMVAIYAQMMQSTSDVPRATSSGSSCSSTSTACSSSSSDSNHSHHSSDSSSDSSCSSCSSCSSGGGD
ncbi:hypothetical protein [uncultured Acinetobacter sp.]|uniref:hypothetical protein n=1 Tax=uncultured Acinetobacter sp. TaxID=165433 RepID=UPI00260154F3|nr:hypothetical protein [uncultured Acinetobacter sp.]